MPSALEQFRLADAGQFQKLRRIDRAGADDDLPVRAGFVLLAVHIVSHADAALALDQQAFGQRIGLDRQVWPPARGVEIAEGGAHPAAIADGRLGHADAVLLRAVIVLGVFDADFAGRLDQRVVDRSGLVAFGDLQRPAAAAVFVVRVALVAFHVPENRQHLAVAPAAIAELRPGVVVLRLAAHEDHAVDRRRAAQQLAARDGNAALAGALVGFRRIQPVGGGVVDQLGEADRDARPGMAFPPRFQHQHLVLGIGAQPVGEDRSRRSRAHHDIIESLVSILVSPHRRHPRKRHMPRGASVPTTRL